MLQRLRDGMQSRKWIDEVFEIALAARPAPRLATPPPAEEKRPRRAGRRSSKQVQAH